MKIDIPSSTLKAIVAIHEGYHCNPKDINLEEYAPFDIADMIEDVILGGGDDKY